MKRIGRRVAGFTVLVWATAACRPQPTDPAPPAPGYELVVAPPAARGARAAGTEGAPAAPTAGELAEPDAEDRPDPEPEEESDAGASQDAGHSLDSTPEVTL